MLGRILLAKLSSEHTTGEDDSSASGDPLSMRLSSYPDLSDLVRGKRVLDFSCGRGDQVAANAHRFAAMVTSLDTNVNTIATAAATHGTTGDFIYYIPTGRRWDIVISINTMAHYNEPPRSACGDAASRRGWRPDSNFIRPTLVGAIWIPYAFLLPDSVAVIVVH